MAEAAIDPPSTSIKAHVLRLIVALLVGGGVGLAVRTWLSGQDLRHARRSAAESRMEEAVSAYRRHLQKLPDDGLVRLELSAVLATQEPELALAELRKIPLESAESTEAARRIATLSLKLGRDYDALGPLLLLQSRLPQDAGIEQSLAELRFRQRLFKAALEHARRARELQQGRAEVLLLIAEIFDELKQPREMTEPLEAALQLDPDLPQAHLNLAYAYRLADRPREALVEVQWFLQRHPQTAAAHRILAQIEQSRGRNKEALESVRHALRLQPRNLDSILLEGELLLALNRIDEASRILAECAENVGDERRLLTLRARAALLAGKADEAERLQSRLRQFSDPPPTAMP